MRRSTIARLAAFMVAAGLLLVLAAPAAFAQERKVIGRVDGYTVVEERQPGSNDRVLYFIEDGALAGSSTAGFGRFSFQPRESGKQTMAFLGTWVLLLGAAFAISKRQSLHRLTNA